MWIQTKHSDGSLSSQSCNVPVYIHMIRTSLERVREAMSRSIFHRSHSAPPISRQVRRETLLPLRHGPCMLAYMRKIEQEDASVSIHCRIEAKSDLFQPQLYCFQGLIRRSNDEDRGGA